MSAAAKPAPSLWQSLRVALDALEEADADATLVADALALAAYVQTHGEEVLALLRATGWDAPAALHDPREEGRPPRDVHQQPYPHAVLRLLRRIVDAMCEDPRLGLRVQATAFTKQTGAPIEVWEYPTHTPTTTGREHGWTQQYDQRPWPLTQAEFIERIRRNRRYEEAEDADRRLPLSALDPIPHETAEITAPDLGHPRPTLSFDLRGLDQLRAMVEAMSRDGAAEARRAWPGPRPAPRVTRHAERARGRALWWRRLGEAAR